MSPESVFHRRERGGVHSVSKERQMYCCCPLASSRGSELSQELLYNLGNPSSGQQVPSGNSVWGCVNMTLISIQTVQNAVTMLCGTEQLLGSLPEVKWAQQVRSLATELQEESLTVIVRHLPRVTLTQAFRDLRRVRPACRPCCPSA